MVEISITDNNKKEKWFRQVKFIQCRSLSELQEKLNDELFFFDTMNNYELSNCDIDEDYFKATIYYKEKL